MASASAAAAAVHKSIYLVIAHGSEVLVGFNENDPIAARPKVPAGCELVLFESCGGYLPTSVDCPLIQLFQDKAARDALEHPALSSSLFKKRMGLPPRVYREGNPHPEINLTLQTSWEKGKCDGYKIYSIMKSGTYKYPLTAENFPPMSRQAGLEKCRVPLPIADPTCHKYASLYTAAAARTTIRDAFTGSVLPTVEEVKPSRGAVGYTYPDMLLSDFLAEMRRRDPGPSIFYIITCRGIPAAMRKLAKYHDAVAKIHAISPKRIVLADNIVAVSPESPVVITAKKKSTGASTRKKTVVAASGRRSPVVNSIESVKLVPIRKKNKEVRSINWNRREAKKETRRRQTRRKEKRLAWMEETLASHS